MFVHMLNVEKKIKILNLLKCLMSIFLVNANYRQFVIKLLIILCTKIVSKAGYIVFTFNYTVYNLNDAKTIASINFFQINIYP